MPLRLRVIPPSSRQTGAADDAAERTVDFDDGVGQIRIGRRAGLELSLPFSSLSGVHARLVRASDSADKTDRWLLEDLGSTNGTFIGGERLKPGMKLPVTAGTQIKVAEVRLIVGDEARAKVDGAVQAEAAHRPTGKVQAEASNRVTSKTVSEVSSKSGAGSGKVQAEASNKVTSKTVSEVSSKSGAGSGKVQAEAPNKVTSKTVSEVSTKPGGDGASKSDVKSRSDVKAPLNEPTQTYVRRQLTDVFGADAAPPQVPYLTAVAGITEGESTFRLDQRDHVYMFGRTRRCEFRVNGNDVSREHASFTRRADGIYVNDLGSVNGVLVNNTRVKEYRLCDGDLIQIGHVKLRLFDPSEGSPRDSERPASASPFARSTPSRSVPSQSASPNSVPSLAARVHVGAPDAPAHAHIEPPAPTYEPPPVRGDDAPAFKSELHPAVAGQLAAEGGGSYRRRPSVRVRIQESWENRSNGFRYAIVIVAASILAVCAVIVGFSLAG